ncbi:SGNH/GDSL hydrolase family protein [Variovorax sp. J22R115]|uniref:SGNH/GDSL hydrolase family protein n=1 Tax=Variovorax sp. J22R115 TaxID=3053509 RepID=UPI002575A503|nr:SGNH/GDSL hydrolase family protein [Variovorax sp. J22R115]MDM0047713.1 SGNH/GDSL hydrolase family protein [Variovorax sp. J22R115]
MNSVMEAPSLRRLAWSLLMALSMASCGGGGSSDGMSTGFASEAQTQAQAAAAAPAISAEAKDAAAKVAAGGGEPAKAVAAALASFQAFRADRIQQVIVFGDSLSDVGTYKVGSIAQAGGGKFTTNPGPIWPETVGVLLGTSVRPFRQGFGGQSQISIPLGTGFAMGGARVSQQPGIGCNPDPVGACRAALTFPVAQQIGDYLDTHGQRFDRTQMVFVFAGSNDLFFQLDRYAHGLQTAAETQAAVVQAAVDLVGQLRRIVDHGATRVAVLTVPDLADTIAGRKLPLAIAANLSAWVTDFNLTLTAGIGGGVKLIDTYAEFKQVVADPRRFGVSTLSVPACDLEAIAEGSGQPLEDASSLFCSPLTLVELNAPFQYFYADTEHPTTLGHLIIARFVLTEMYRQGLI